MRKPVASRTGPVAIARRTETRTTLWLYRLKIHEWVGGIALFALVITPVVGTLAAAGFVAALLVLIAVRPFEALRDLGSFGLLLVLPVLAMVSALWSPAPQMTLRAAIQVLVTMAGAILVARRTPGHSMMLWLFSGYLVTCLLLLPSVPASLTSGQALYSAYLGSKNQVGFAGHMLFAIGLAVAGDRDQRVIARLLALAALPLGYFIVRASQSGGAFTSLVITLLTFPPLLLLARVRPALRNICLAAGALALVVALVFLPAIEGAVADFRVNVLKKDATLTGRTHLWDVASQISAKNPWLGEGFAAFWRQGNLDAEGLWRWGGIANRGGFNFHSAFVEIRVDLGWVGLGLLIAMCVGIASVSLIRLATRPTVPVAFFLSLITVLYARSFTETGLIAPFSVLTFIWIAAAVYALAPTGAVSSNPLRRARGTAQPRARIAVARRI